MAIKSICKTNVVTTSKNSTLKNVSQLMQQQHVGSVVVTEFFNGKQILAGIITDRDIALSVGSTMKPQNLRAENIMQSQPVTVRATDGIFETVIKMRERGVKRLPVINEDGSLYGIVCADDFLVLLGAEINDLAKVTETQIKREQGIRMPTEKHVQL